MCNSKGVCLSVFGSRKSSEKEDRNLKFVQKLTAIVGSAVLNLIEGRMGRRELPMLRLTL